MQINDTKTNFEEIVKIYKQIYKYFFKYTIFAVTIIISFFVFKNILANYFTSNTIITENHSFNIKEKELILNFNKLLKQNIENTDVEIHILQGYINNNGDYLESMNNLVSYKGFIVPRFFYIYKTLPLKPMSYFNSESYDIKELNNFIQNIILVKKENTEKLKANQQLPIQDTMKDTFDLNCLFKTKALQTICNNALSDFLDSFFIYNINLDYQGLKDIYDKIKKDKEHKKKFCEGLEKYIIYSNDTSTQIENLIKNCDEQSLQNFKRLQTFIEVQQQLENKQITTTIYNDNYINEYKLLSIMQIIYDEIINNRTDTTNTLQYLNLIKETLKINKIDPFYKDLVYRFNNNYIKPWVENPDNPINKNNKTESLEISKQIIITNNGSSLYGFDGLESQLQNINLISNKKGLEISSDPEEIQRNRIIKLLENISYLKIKDQTFSGDILYINSDLFINDTLKQNQNQKIKLDTSFVLSYKNNDFIINRIKITNQTALTTILKEIISKEPYSLNQIFEYIQQNYALYNQVNTTEKDTYLCDNIKEKFKNDIANVNECNTNNVKINRIESDQTTINYEIKFKDYKITSITVSDKEIEKEINNKINNIETNDINFADIILSIVYYTKASETTQGSQNIIIVTDKIKNYLGITIEDIAEKDNKILVQFSIGGISLIGNYMLYSNTIYPIYFKDILTNDLPTRITNLSLSLDDQNKTDIYKFISDPVSYIKNISEESYSLYLQFISTQQ